MTRAYTVSTLAAEWQCSPSLIRKLIRDGQLGCFRLGVLIRIPAEEARRFECQNIVSSDSGADMPSSIEMPPGSDTESAFEQPTVLGLKRKPEGAGQRGATVLHGRWAQS